MEMTQFDWTLWMIAFGVSLLGVMLTVFMYFKTPTSTEGRRKVVLRAFIWCLCLTIPPWLIGIVVIGDENNEQHSNLHKLQGVILDAHGEPLAQAQVGIQGKRDQYTDSKGLFSFMFSNKQLCHLIISKDGFITKEAAYWTSSELVRIVLERRIEEK